MFVFYVN